MFCFKIFLFGLFVFSPLAIGELGESEHLEQQEFGFPPGLKDFIQAEIPLPLSIKEGRDHFYSAGVVRLIFESEDQMALGTGFFIRPDILATAAHGIEFGTLYFIDPYTGDPVFTEVLATDAEYDIALLKAVDYKSKHFYSIGSFDDDERIFDFITVTLYGRESYPLPPGVVKGASAITAGFPHGFFNVVQGFVEFADRNAVVVSVTNIKKTITMNIPTEEFSKDPDNRVKKQVVFSEARRKYDDIDELSSKADNEISIFSGMSGGPVFSEEGKLLGVAITGSTLDAPIDSVGFTPVEMLRILVRKAKGEEALSPELRQQLKQELLSVARRKTLNFRVFNAAQVVPQKFKILIEELSQ